MSGDQPPKTTEPSDAERDERFLSRWSRRKREQRAPAAEPQAEASRPAAPSPPPAGVAGDARDGEPVGAAPEPVLSDADMPPLETLDENSDYSGFLSPGVSEQLRRAALRKLFGSPVFNVVDGLDDYDDDFRTFEALGDIVTAEMRGQLERDSAGEGTAGGRGDGAGDTPAPHVEHSAAAEVEADEVERVAPESTRAEAAERDPEGGDAAPDDEDLDRDRADARGREGEPDGSSRAG